MRHLDEKVDELKDLKSGVDFMICLGKPVLRAPAVHGVSSIKLLGPF